MLVSVYLYMYKKLYICIIQFTRKNACINLFIHVHLYHTVHLHKWIKCSSPIHSYMYICAIQFTCINACFNLFIHVHLCHTFHLHKYLYQFIYTCASVPSIICFRFGFWPTPHRVYTATSRVILFRFIENLSHLQDFTLRLVANLSHLQDCALRSVANQFQLRDTTLKTTIWLNK